ncbi:MAG TPA: amidohydrolase family protein [Longimicrobiales bacterium]
MRHVHVLVRVCARVAALGLLLMPAAAHAQSVAITNARIHTVSGPVIERGTVVMRDGKIVSVGADVAVPAGARVIDAAGKIVTPGLIDSSTGLGTVEIDADQPSNDQSVTGDRITAAFNVADNLNPLSTLFPVTRVEGITRAVVVPGGGSTIINGQGVLIDLGTQGATINIHRNPVAMYAVLGEAGANRAGGSRAAAILRLREALQDARDYAANRRAFESAQRRDYALSRLDLEALQPVLRGELPMVISMHRASDILNAIRLAREFNLRLIVSGAAEGWLVARELAAADIPVIINPMNNIPGLETLGITLENAARLHGAGVNVVFASFESHNSRNLKQLAGNAVSYGMPFDAALRAVTLNPARLWGIANRYGSIEAGKDADIVVWSADPFELTTTVEHVFINGREVADESRQRALFNRYRRLNGALPEAYIR